MICAELVIAADHATLEQGEYAFNRLGGQYTFQSPHRPQTNNRIVNPLAFCSTINYPVTFGLSSH